MTITIAQCYAEKYCRLDY